MISGCALNGFGPAPATTVPETTAAEVTAPQITDIVSKSKISNEITSQCSKILKLSQAGEHQSAVELADKLTQNGDKCPEEISKRIDFSRSKLNQANAYVLKALKFKKEGRLLEAQTNLRKALEIYPKYYWARNLLKKVERSINVQLNSLMEESRNLEASGDLDGALSLVQDAVTLAPDDNELRAEASRLQETLDSLQQTEKKQKHLEEIMTQVDPVLGSEVQKLLEDEAVAKCQGAKGAEPLQAIRERRLEIIRKGFTTAREAEQKDDLERAADHTMYVLELSAAEDPLTPDIIEFARLLGLKLFSAGNFSKARELWKGALRIVPDNVRLRKYLAEVEERLDNLKKIQPSSPTPK